MIGKTMYSKWPRLRPGGKCDHSVFGGLDSHNVLQVKHCGLPSEIVIGLLSDGEVWMFIDVCHKHADSIVRAGEGIVNPKRNRRDQ